VRLVEQSSRPSIRPDSVRPGGTGQGTERHDAFRVGAEIRQPPQTGPEPRRDQRDRRRPACQVQPREFLGLHACEPDRLPQCGDRGVDLVLDERIELVARHAELRDAGDGDARPGDGGQLLLRRSDQAAELRACGARLRAVGGRAQPRSRAGAGNVGGDVSEQGLVEVVAAQVRGTARRPGDRQVGGAPAQHCRGELAAAEIDDPDPHSVLLRSPQVSPRRRDGFRHQPYPLLRQAAQGCRSPQPIKLGAAPPGRVCEHHLRRRLPVADPLCGPAQTTKQRGCELGGVYWLAIEHDVLPERQGSLRRGLGGFRAVRSLRDRLPAGDQRTVHKSDRRGARFEHGRRLTVDRDRRGGERGAEVDGELPPAAAHRNPPRSLMRFFAASTMASRLSLDRGVTS
jgi:hypothetical protein